jgi:hypothetical protein
VQKVILSSSCVTVYSCSLRCVLRTNYRSTDVSLFWLTLVDNPRPSYLYNIKVVETFGHPRGLRVEGGGSGFAGLKLPKSKFKLHRFFRHDYIRRT